MQEKLSITGSGRTDAGVHAYQQFFHFDLSEPVDPGQLVYKMNLMLPREIAIKNIFTVKNDAHARFDAIKRSYVYKIIRSKDPFSLLQSYQYFTSLDFDAMNQASQTLLGEQDFKSFSKVKTEVNNFFCNVFDAQWFEEKDEMKFYISANRFLRGMVRAIVGTLLMVGEGKVSIDEFKEIIKKKDRRSAGRAVPPEGLYLKEVFYSQDIFINN